MKEKSVIATIIDMVRLSDFANESEALDIAKGKYQAPMNWKGMKNSILRTKKYK